VPISPASWRRYIKPAYQAIVAPCKEVGIPFYLHSDGHILEIIPDLVECGVTAINPQIRANGLEGLKKVAKGKVCINLDLDRQLFPFASKAEIQEHIRTAVEALNSPRGGLMLTAECEPDVPLENIRAICETLEEVGAGPA
jgi:uroporphyrinogen decarboxylase